MSFDGYVQYMQQKYRLAIVLAVIKTKPIDASIKDHINSINRFNKSKMDEVSENDFNFDDDVGSDDSFTILKDLPDILNRGDNPLLVKPITSTDKHKPESDSDVTFFEESQCIDKSLNTVDTTDVKEGNNDSLLPKQYNSQATVLYTVPNNDTHISQSQDNIIIMGNYINSKENDIKNMNSGNQKQLHAAEKTININYSTCEIDNISDKIDNSDNCRSFNEMKESEDGHNVYQRKNFKTSQDNEIPETPKKFSISQNGSHTDEMEYCSLSKNFDKIVDKNMSDIGDEMDLDSSLTESQAEMVSFKVLEELSRIKQYLHRLDNKEDNDSGYRSTQTRSCRGSQPSGCWNESAYCLLDFLTSCPLVVNIMDVCEEISKVLGQFVDRLHHEETYPRFMETMLDTIERLINDIYNYKCYDDDAMYIEEKIHRMYLLNHSQHIIKYSLEKITIILDGSIPQIKDIEIKNTDRSENLCYVINIMEILLKKFLTYQKNMSQSTQSQEETVLKKSSLTEIWRKKWNLSKDEVFDVQVERKCVLSECSNVLNRLIVETIDHYSLVSYAALQCFNLMQK